jgi:hypothetical protein
VSTVQAPHWATPEFRSGHAEDIAQDPQKRRIAIGVDGMRGAIDLDPVTHADTLVLVGAPFSPCADSSAVAASR